MTLLRRSLSNVCALTIGIPLCACALPIPAQSNSSKKIADALIERANRADTAPAWSGRETGFEVEGMAAAWYNSANGEDFRFIQREVDAYLEGDHSAGDPDDEDLAGRALLLMYGVTQDAKYFRAAQALEKKLEARCGWDAARETANSPMERAPCTAEPFLAEYLSLYRPGAPFDRITRQFELWYEVQSGLSAHAERGAAEANGAIGMPRLAAALVDALPYYVATDPGRTRLVVMLRRIADDAARRQDPGNGLLYGAPDRASGDRKPLATPDAALMIYAWMKGERLGYLQAPVAASAVRAWKAILAKGEPESDSNAGPLLLAASQMDLAATRRPARGMTVLLDSWYNSQQRRNAAGVTEYFHYKWDDFSDSGYSLFGHMWRSFGAAPATLATEPEAASLKAADVYIIVSPDNPSKNPNPHYVTEADAAVIAKWVRQGGVLALMENDPANADIEHMNLLSDRFGVHFDNVLHHHIVGEQVADGRIPVSAGGSLFQHAHTIYMKDTCAISLHGPATALLRDRGDVVMASARFGRGTVFAAVDPWLYNEYTDGRKNPAIYSQFDNFAAGKELVAWLIQQRLHDRESPGRNAPR